MSAPERGPLAEQVVASERRALDALTAAASGVPLCRIDGSGASPAKRWEGRSAALAQVRRDLARAARAGDGASEQEIVRRQLTEWHERSAQSTLVAGPAWTAYLEGGIGALTELVGDEPTAIVEDR